MAGTAVIGALRVNLGLDSAEFSAGLKKAQAGLSSFGKVAAVGFAAAATAAVAAGAALAIAGKRAIDAADDMSKAAQKTGVATEARARLNYAAGYADVSLEQLSGGLLKLSKGLGDIGAGGKGGPAATALAALGISAKDTYGKLRDADAVFAEVAERFSRMEDGTTKTALALQLFGKSGADLIPLLNSGRDGLKEMADESDRLGLTISTKTGLAAEQFNDTLTKVGKILDGVALKVAAAALPALQQLADVLASPAFATAMQDFAVTVINAMKDISPYVINAANNLRMLRDLFVEASQRSTEGIKGTVVDLQNQVTTLENSIVGNKARLANGDDLFGINRGAIEAQIAKDIAAVQPLIDKIGELQRVVAERDSLSDSAAPATPDDAGVKPFIADMDALKTSTDAATLATKVFAQAQAEGQKVFEATRTPLEGMQVELDKLGQLLNQGVIDWETYGRAVGAATLGVADATLSSVGTITGALAGAFKDNKAFAVADAIVNTAQGITKALAQGGVLGFAGAAAVAVAGAAQIATILSTQKGSSSKPSATGGGAAAAVATPAPAPAAGRAVNVTLVGGSRYSRSEVEGLIRDINDGLSDGMKLNVSNA